MRLSARAESVIGIRATLARTSVAVRTNDAPSIIEQAPPLVLLALLLVGGFSLSRIDSSWESGLDGELRYWIGAFLALIAVAKATSAGTVRSDRLLRSWLTFAVLLHALVAVSVVWSPTPPATGPTAVLDLGLLIGILLVSPAIFSGFRDGGVSMLLRAVCWTSFVLVIIGLVLQGGVVGEITQMGAGSIGMSRIVGIGIIGAIYFWKKTGQLWWLVPVPMMLSSILVSDTRAAVLGLAIAVLLLVFAKASLLSAFRAVILFAVGAVAMFASGSGREAMRTFWESIWAGGEIYISGRDLLFRDAWELFLQHPWLGAGHGAYYSEYTESTYPHNLVLNVAADTGGAGLLLFGSAVTLLMMRWFRPRSLENTVAGFAGLYSLICCMFAGSYYEARFMWVFFFLYMLPQDVSATRPPYRARSQA